MGIFANATIESKRNDENKTAPDYFKSMDKVDIKTVKDVITIDNAIVRVKPKIVKDENGQPVKDENGKFITMLDFNKKPVMSIIAFVSFDNGSKYFVTTSRPIINQFKVIDKNIDFKMVGDYTIDGIKDSKVKITTTPVKLSDGKEYEYPVFIDVED